MISAGRRGRGVVISAGGRGIVISAGRRGRGVVISSSKASESESSTTENTGRRPVVNKGDICEVKFKLKWYKAKVLDVLDGGQKYKVCFLDFKYLPVVKATDIRQMQ